jgi:hypothetical protein
MKIKIADDGQENASFASGGGDSNFRFRGLIFNRAEFEKAENPGSAISSLGNRADQDYPGTKSRASKFLR